ncbi:SIR2 family protein [Micropruina sp.]|uniref:SIR2 family protein n=1 Tax=Micropruina sp. TaxID=2737536 RepID=UPI0039E37F7D
MPNPLSAAAMLATSMHAQPGVYALLLGSGVSTGAGIPTGWGVVKELVRRVAAVEDPDTLAVAETDPEQWWRDHHDGDLGYAALLEALAPTPAARQGILADFFEPTDEEREQGIKTPSKAHLAIAELVKRGTVKVIVTTNFDRLMEQALDAVGVAPQVISRPEAVAGMKPLVHAPATVIKLHGDYLDLGSRNTPSELEEYPDEWKTLLTRVLDEYGLVISGWSADWDTALVSLIDTAPNRRYPMYWDGRSSRGTNAQRLLAARSGTVVPAAGADEMFLGLGSNIATLDRLAEPPLSTAMAVARLKRYLADPVHRVDLYDLVMAAVDQSGAEVQAHTLHVPSIDGETLDSILTAHREGVMPLLHLLATGIWHDTRDDHADLWVDAVQRLVAQTTTAVSSCTQGLDRLRIYPAILAQYVLGIAAIARRRENLMIRVLTEVRGKEGMGHGAPVPAYELLDPGAILSPNGANALSRWNGQRWIFPMSRLLREDVRPAFLDLIPDDETYLHLTWGWEYRIGLVQAHNNAYPFYGESGGETAWYGKSNSPACESDFLDRQERDSRWPWTDYLGGAAKQEALMEQHRKNMREMFSQRRFG